MTTITPTAAEIWASLEAEKARLAEQMPTETDAIRAMFDAYRRLKDLGWRDGGYLPINGGRHAGICCGSTGIHAYAARRHEDMSVMYEVYDGDIWPTRTPPVLFREWRADDAQQNLRPTYLGMLGDTE